MTDPTLQAYYDAHERMIDVECYDEIMAEPWDMWTGPWAMWTGLYKIARYNAVRAGLIPETPQFDVETAR